MVSHRADQPGPRPSLARLFGLPPGPGGWPATRPCLPDHPGGGCGAVSPWGKLKRGPAEGRPPNWAPGWSWCTPPFPLAARLRQGLRGGAWPVLATRPAIRVRGGRTCTRCPAAPRVAALRARKLETPARDGRQGHATLEPVAQPPCPGSDALAMAAELGPRLAHVAYGRRGTRDRAAGWSNLIPGRGFPALRRAAPAAARQRLPAAMVVLEVNTPAARPAARNGATTLAEGASAFTRHNLGQGRPAPGGGAGPPASGGAAAVPGTDERLRRERRSAEEGARREGTAPPSRPERAS